VAKSNTKPNEESRVINTVFWIYTIAFVAMVIIGVCVFLAKIPKIKKYKFENPWTEISPKKKTALFFASIPVIIMMILVINELSQYIVLRQLIS